MRLNKKMSEIIKPLHPGEVLQELYLTPLGISAITLAKKILVPRTRIERLLRGDTSLSADTAIRLARIFGTTPEYWLNMQRAFDLANVKKSIDLSKIEPFNAA